MRVRYHLAGMVALPAAAIAVIGLTAGPAAADGNLPNFSSSVNWQGSGVLEFSGQTSAGPDMGFVTGGPGIGGSASYNVLPGSAGDAVFSDVDAVLGGTNDSPAFLQQQFGGDAGQMSNMLQVSDGTGTVNLQQFGSPGVLDQYGNAPTFTANAEAYQFQHVVSTDTSSGFLGGAGSGEMNVFAGSTAYDFNSVSGFAMGGVVLAEGQGGFSVGGASPDQLNGFGTTVEGTPQNPATLTLTGSFDGEAAVPFTLSGSDTPGL